MTVLGNPISTGGNIIQYFHAKMYTSVFKFKNHHLLFKACSILTLNPFLCKVFGLVKVFVSQPYSPMYGHFTVMSSQHLNSVHHTEAKPSTLI